MLNLPDAIPHDEMMLRSKEWMLAGELVLLRGDFLIFHTHRFYCECPGYRREADTWILHRSNLSRYWYNGDNFCELCPAVEECRTGHEAT